MYLEVNDRQIPTGRAIPVQGSTVDFLELRPIGSTKLDTAFASLVSDADGLTRVELQAPSGRPSLMLWMDKSDRFVMAFTGDALPQVDRRRWADASRERPTPGWSAAMSTPPVCTTCAPSRWRTRCPRSTSTNRSQSANARSMTR